MSALFFEVGLFPGGIGGADRFWIDTATELCKNSLACFLSSLVAYLSRPSIDTLFRDGKGHAHGRGKREAFELDQRQPGSCFYMKIMRLFFSSLDDKVKRSACDGGAGASPFSASGLVDAFCTDHEEQ
jgi:hypothetical protein